MIFILGSAATYCFSMTVALGCFAFDQQRFTGSVQSSNCVFNGIDVSTRMQTAIKFGFWTHFIGFFCDSSMIIRVKSKNQTFNLIALVAVSLYTCAFVAWLIWIMVLRFREAGKYCSGDFSGI